MNMYITPILSQFPVSHILLTHINKAKYINIIKFLPRKSDFLTQFSCHAIIVFMHLAFDRYWLANKTNLSRFSLWLEKYTFF